jgi:2-oxoglutarate ferredoxin oxidoreductase subunit beta
MSAIELQEKEKSPLSIKDLFTENPRWCVGCGDFGIVMGLKRFMVNGQLDPAHTVNVSGIGCSGRAPNYINTYGVHAIHGRAITVALGLALTRPDLKLFIHSGDGDALSIGGNHLLHGVNKNFNCVFLLYDNELYALTKSQTSPTTRQGHKTNTQPQGTFLPPLNPIRLVLGIGASFVARTADWLPDHMVNTLEAAFQHKGFSFVHISQRCPHFDPNNFNHKESDWFSFLTHPDGVAADKRIADKTQVITHDPQDLKAALEYAHRDRVYFGLFYRDLSKPCYEEIMQNQIKKTPQKSRKNILDKFMV